MRIAIFTNNYLPNPYGVTGSIENFRKEFEKRGHTVYIFAPNYKDYSDKNENVFRYPSVDIKYKIRFPLPIPYSRKINRFLENEKIDIIHSQHPNLLGGVALKWARKKNVPIVFTWHTLYDQYTHYAPLISNKILSSLVIKNAVKYANKVDQVVVPTKSVKKIISDWGVKNEITDIITGVDGSDLQNANASALKNELKITEGKKILLSISRLTEEKNMIFLFKAVVDFMKKNPETVFVCGGDGYQLKALKNIVAENGLKNRVYFVGLVPEKDLKNYFALADLFVYASKSETQGTIITKAMYGGLPVVALDATGVGDLIEGEKNGILVKENKNDFIGALNRVLLDDDFRNFLAENAEQKARREYTGNFCAEKMLNLYKKLIVGKELPQDNF